MKHTAWLGAALGAALLAAAGCSQEPAAETTTPPTTAATTKPYPLTVCVVSGEKLDSMGEPHVIVFESQEVKFCCKDCVKDFEKDTAKFLAKLK